MVESRLPWWLVLLLGVGVVALTVWSWPHSKREVRWGAGLLSLAYAVLLFMARGGDPRAGPVAAAEPLEKAVVSWSFLVSGTIALLAGFLLLGRPRPRGQLTWFSVLTTANAASCLACGSAGAGWSLLLMSGATIVVLVIELRRGDRPSLNEWFPITKTDDRPSSSVELVGATGFLLALLFVGTLAYVIRVETTRTTATHRYSAIPSADRVRAGLAAGHGTESHAVPFALVLGRRADVIVLLSVLAFLALAMHNSTGGTMT